MAVDSLANDFNNLLLGYAGIWNHVYRERHRNCKRGSSILAKNFLQNFTCKYSDFPILFLLSELILSVLFLDGLAERMFPYGKLSP